MNPYDVLIKHMGLSAANSQGDYAWLYMVLSLMSASFNDPEQNVHDTNPAREVLRRIALVVPTDSHCYHRLESILSHFSIAYDLYE